MASINRPTVATHTIHKSLSFNTPDQQDHTFSGIVFPVTCSTQLPVHSITITSVSVRGDLGGMTVWATNQSPTAYVGGPSAAREASVRDFFDHSGNGWARIARSSSKATISPPPLDQNSYNLLHTSNQPSSPRSYKALQLSTPILLSPGNTTYIYIHSDLIGDTGLVYDNYAGSGPAVQTDYLTIDAGLAHVSPQAFGNRTLWGYGGAWRGGRCFVGEVNYGVTFKL